MDAKRRFRFRLALSLGLTVSELEAKMSAEELQEWMEYYEVEPFGEERADLRAALICLTLARINGAKEAKIDDFLLNFEQKTDDINEMDKRLLKAFLKV